MCDRVLCWESSQNSGKIRLLPRGTPPLCSVPAFGNPRCPYPSGHHLFYPTPPFPASGEKEFGCWAPLPISPSSLLSPAMTFGATRPRLLLKPEMHLHSL